MKMSRLAVLFGVICLGSTTYALPDMKFLGKGFGQNIKWTLDNGENYQTTFAGEMNLRLTTVEGISEFVGFCVDAKVRVSDGTWGVQILDTDSLVPNGGRIAQMVNTYAGAINANYKGAALQLVIWEYLYETSGVFDLQAGTFRAKKSNGDPLGSNLLNFANSMISTHGESIAPYFLADMNGNKRSSQSFVAPVPEPATLLGLSLFAATALARRKRK
jgi:hypothetical protein